MQLPPFLVLSHLTPQGAKDRCPSPVQELGGWEVDAEESGGRGSGGGVEDPHRGLGLKLRGSRIGVQGRRSRSLVGCRGLGSRPRGRRSVSQTEACGARASPALPLVGGVAYRPWQVRQGQPSQERTRGIPRAEQIALNSSVARELPGSPPTSGYRQLSRQREASRASGAGRRRGDPRGCVPPASVSHARGAPAELPSAGLRRPGGVTYGTFQKQT